MYQYIRTLALQYFKWSHTSVWLVTLLLSVSVYAEKATLQSLIEAVNAIDTPNIDAAVTINQQLCSFDNNEGLSEVTSNNLSQAPQRFHAASVSKLLTGIVIMQLRDEHKLALGDQVGLYEPAFKGSDVRLKHLLTHTSGLRDRKRANGRSETEQVEKYIRSLAKQRLNGKPGEKWRYADANFNLLGRVIESITQQSYVNVMKDRILRPLGMQYSDFDINQIPEEFRELAYNKRGKVQEHPWDLAFLPSSGLQTTAIDLVRFGQAILSIHKGERSQEWLSKSTLIEMTTKQMDTEWTGVGQGYAWQLVKTRQGDQWRHAGGEDGFESLLTLYPKYELGISVLGNQKDWPRFELELAIRKSLISGQVACD